MSKTPNKALLKTDTSAQMRLGSDVFSSANDSSVLSVEQMNLQIKTLLEGQVGIVWVRGELSNFKAHSSGHFYFSLKDAKSQITAVMFRGNNARLKFKPHDGMEVVVRARISVYEPRGNYQLLCDTMEPVGAGALQKAFEQLKAKLKAEGLFDPARKVPIPTFPKHIAVVTSPTGAAIRDILNVLSRRAKSIAVTVVPTVVQGEAAAPSICQAFLKAQKLPDVDVIIIGRGGGSTEDMWCFNDENLARLIADSKIPVISAVGHEIDFTISDFVADLRAPTPSAAAEMVAKSAGELTSKLQSLERMLKLSMQRSLQFRHHAVLGFAKRLFDPQRKLQDLILKNDDLLSRLEGAKARYLEKLGTKIGNLQKRLGSPERRLESKRKEFSFLESRLQKSIAIQLDRKKNRKDKVMAILDSLSPLKVVERGYSIVTKDGQVVKNSEQVAVNDVVEIRLAQGTLEASIQKIKES